MQQDALARVRLVSTMVERELDSQVIVLSGIARSSRLDGGVDVADFTDFLGRIRQGQPHWINVVLSDPHGRRLADVPALTSPPAFVADLASHQRAVATGKPVVGGMMRRAHGGLGIVVHTPVIRNGQVKYVLSAGIEPSGFARLLATDELPRNWRSAILDASGRLVAGVGPKASPADVGTIPSARIAEDRKRGPGGFYPSVGPGGEHIHVAYRMVPRYGWSVHVVIPVDLYRAPVSRGGWLVAALGALSLLLALAFLLLLIRELQLRQREGVALEQARRMEALGRMTGGVAHDFNNLLMIVQGSAEMMKRRAGEPGRITTLSEAILAASQRGQALTRQLLAFARRGSHEPCTFILQSRSADIADFLERSAGSGVEVELSIPDETWPVFADPNVLEIALINLAVNARDAMPGGGRLTVTAANVTLQQERGNDLGLEGDFVALTVRDTGLGIAEENLAHVFEPFFTTKPAGRGTGLGLSQVYGFAKQSGGTASVTSRPGAGATFTLYLPRSREAAAPPAPAAADEQVHADGRLLLVEDDPEVGNAVAAMMEAAGYRVTRAANAAEALTLIESGQDFDAVLSDIVMPGAMSGLELAGRLQAIRPNLAIVLISGYSEALARGAACPWTVLSKPFTQAQAVAALAAARRQAA